MHKAMGLRNIKKRTKIIQVGDLVTVKSNGKVISTNIEITAIHVEIKSRTGEINLTLNQ